MVSHILLVCFSGLPLLDPRICKRTISKANIPKGGQEVMLSAAWNFIPREFLLVLHSVDPEIAADLNCSYDCFLALREVFFLVVVTH